MYIFILIELKTRQTHPLGCGFSAGASEATHAHTRPTQTRLPTWVYKPVTSTSGRHMQYIMESPFSNIKCIWKFIMRWNCFCKQEIHKSNPPPSWASLSTSTCSSSNGAAASLCVIGGCELGLGTCFCLEVVGI